MAIRAQPWACDVYNKLKGVSKNKSNIFGRHRDFYLELPLMFLTRWGCGVAVDCPGYCWAKTGHTLDRSPGCHRAYGAGAIKPAMLGSRLHGGQHNELVSHGQTETSFTFLFFFF